MELLFLDSHLEERMSEIILMSQIKEVTYLRLKTFKDKACKKVGAIL